MAGPSAAQIGGVGDLFQGIATGIGDFAEASAYKKAQRYALNNANIAQEAGDIKMEQTKRAIFKTIGAQEAGYAGAGLTSSGSAQEVLRSSISQGALEKAIVNAQTQINVNGYKQEAAEFAGMATAAKAAGIGAIIGSVADAAMAFSDRRMKTDIQRVGSHGELGLYRYRFLGEDRMRVGVMADEVAIHAPHALGPVIGGYSTVNYRSLGLGSLVEGG
jgi:hypothetical protein